jgi:hypothetical protein
VFPHGYGSQASMMQHYSITAERTMAVVHELLAARPPRVKSHVN